MVDPKTAWNIWHVIVSLVTGAGFQRALVAIVGSMPPLPSDANWWEKWAYASLKALTGKEPSGQAPNGKS